MAVKPTTTAATGPLRVAQAGQALVEYGLILALIAIVAIGATLYLGGQTSATLSDAGEQISAAAGVSVQATAPPSAYTKKKQCTAAGYTWVAAKGKVKAHCQ